MARHDLPVAVHGPRGERHRVRGRGPQGDVHAEAELARVDVVLELLRAKSAHAHLAFERVRVHRIRELEADPVALGVGRAVGRIRLLHGGHPDRGERGGALPGGRTAARASLALVHGDEVLRARGHARGRVEGERRAIGVPGELPAHRRAGLRVAHAQAVGRGGVHRLVEDDDRLLPRPAVEPASVGRDRVHRGSDGRERRMEVALEDAVRGGGEAPRDGHAVRRGRYEVCGDEAVDRGVEPLAFAMERWLEHEYGIGPLRGERRERGHGAAELHEHLSAQRDLGVAVAGDDLLDGELAGDRELPRDGLRHAGLGARGDVDGVHRAAEQTGKVRLEKEGARRKPRVGTLRLGVELQEGLGRAIGRRLGEGHRDRREPRDVVAAGRELEGRRLASERRQLGATDELTGGDDDREQDDRRTRAAEAAHPVQRREAACGHDGDYRCAASRRRRTRVA